jgi:hypothetical membrane protein
VANVPGLWPRFATFEKTGDVSQTSENESRGRAKMKGGRSVDAGPRIRTPSFVRYGAIAGLASPIIFITLVVVMGSLYPGYSHLKNFISDLGALDAPRPYVQRLNFFQFGIGISVLALALYNGMERASRIGLASQLTIGLGIFLSGVFPGETSDPESHESLLHNLMGVPAFLLIILVPFITGWTFRKRDEWRDLARYSIAMTPLLVALFILMGYADSRPRGTPGLFQRLFMGTWILWMILISSRLYRLEVKRSGQRLNSRTWGAA